MQIKQLIEINFLADCPETIPTLARWFLAQWPDYYAGRTLEEIAGDFHAEANRDTLPTRLVAFVEGELVGTITLRASASQSLPQYRPGLGGLLVVEKYRGRGLGTALVKAGMNVAQEQGFPTVYATTKTARGILERLGWEGIPIAGPEERSGTLYRCDL